MLVRNSHVLIFIIIVFFATGSMAAKLVTISAVDNQYLVIHFQDGMVEYNLDDPTSGSCNGWDFLHTENWHLCPDKDQYIPFGLPLNTTLAQQPGSLGISILAGLAVYPGIFTMFIQNELVIPVM